MSADIIAKVQALLARTASSFEEEARTSAVIACRLICEHKIELFLPGTAPRPVPPPRRPARRIVIVSKYPGRCWVCADPYDVGEPVSWCRGDSAVHVYCAQFLEAVA